MAAAGDLRQPLLGAGVGRAGDAQIAGTAAASADVAVQLVTSSAAVSVNGAQELAYPARSGAVQEQIDDSKDAGNVKAKMTMSAQLGISGNAKAVSETIKYAHHAVQHTLADIEARALMPLSVPRQAQLTEEFHHDLLEIIEHDQASNKPALMRQSSAEFVASFERADSLVEQGAEGYIQAVRRLLRVDESKGVTVSYKNLSFEGVPKAENEQGKEPIATVGTAFVATVCGLFSALRDRACKAPGKPTPVLQRLSGVIKPGRLTLVLGPPGSGKSVFLKALAGRMLNNPGGELSGQLAYNGRSASDLNNLAAWSAYVGQSDEHQALMTVRETLQFAWECRRKAVFASGTARSAVQSRHGQAGVDKLDVFSEAEVDLFLAILGLSRCADTIIGNETLKGVSGGEKRRVTLGEMLVTGAQFLCADSVSTGLDAAATYDITAFLSRACKVLNQTVAVALLQPPPEVIDLFDDIICLASGRVIYHGPRAGVLSYFEGLGFKCPPNKDLGDFLQELPTPGGRKFVDAVRQTGRGPKPPTTPSEFADRWEKSDLYRTMMAEVDSSLQKPATDRFDFDEQPQAGFWTLLWLCTSLAMRLRLREKAQLVSKLFANIVMGAFYGSLFFQLSSDQWYMKAVLLFQVPSFILSSAFPQVQVVAKNKPIILKHLDGSFFSPMVFTFSQFIVAMPFILFDIAAFGNVVYWMCGLANVQNTFLIFLALAFSYGAFMNTLMGMLPFFSSNEDGAVLLCCFYLITSMIFCGLTPTVDVIPDYLVWLYWINPLAWVFQALSINEYHSGGPYDAFPCVFEMQGQKFTIQQKCGDYFLSARHVSTNDAYVPYTFVLVWGQTCLVLVLSIWAAAKLRFDEQRASRVKESDSDDSSATANSIGGGGDDVEASRLMGSGRGGRSGMPPLMRQTSIVVHHKQLTVRNLHYSININGENVEFLKGVSFWTMPGRMTALMGSSGAGKTTLMDVIAGRKTVGVSTGEILIDGEPKVQSQFVKYAAYVEQFGVHVPTSTIREAFEFSALLRLPSTTPPADRATFVSDTLELLELTDLADQLCLRLSMEQNKRVTLGVELVANPSIVFADEPTSGLEARAAAIVMRVLSKVAKSGRTVVCTIHQPSAAIFSFFDDLLLLKRGGQVVFFGELGPGAKNLVDFLQAVPGTPPFVPGPGANPASWMLDVIGAGVGQAVDSSVEIIDYANEYHKSALKRANEMRLDTEFVPRKLSRALSGMMSSGSRRMKLSNEAAIKRPYVRGLAVQMWALSNRLQKQYWRTPEFTYGRMVVSFFFAMVFGLTFYQTELHNAADVQSRVILLFFFGNLLSMFNMYTVVPFSLARRAVFYRETATGMYSITSYVIADSLVELPYTLFQTIFGVTIVYLMIGFNTNIVAVLFYYSNAFCLVLLLTYMGLLFSWLLPDALSAQLSAISFIQVLQIFSGVLVPAQDLAKGFKPFYWASPYRWSIECQVGTQFHNDQTQLCVPFGVPAHGPLVEKAHLCTSDGSNDFEKVTGIIMTAEDFVMKEFLPDFHYDRRYWDMLFLVCWIVGARVLTVLAMSFINHNRR